MEQNKNDILKERQQYNFWSKIMKYFREKLSSNNVKERIIWAIILFFIFFFSIVIIGYYFLPEGLLKNKNPAQNWNFSDSAVVLTLQIFFYNLISVVIIFLTSLFANKKSDEKEYLSVGYTVFYTLIAINAAVLGSWSFSVETTPPSLLSRILGTFNLINRAALWEMIGQLLITCATSKIAVIKSCGKQTIKSSLKETKLEKSEKIIFLTGIILMLIGAIIESIAINKL